MGTSTTSVLCLFAALGCDASGAGETIRRHDFPAVTIGPYEETDALCQSWTLDNDEPLYVNSVAMSNASGFHHSNWFYVPEDLYQGPDGTWPCADRDWDQLETAVAGGVVFAMSTQVTEEVQAFPEGAVYVIPPRSRIVGNLHLLSASAEPLETRLSMELHTIAEEAVQVKLHPIAFAYEELAIPPAARSRFEASCDFEAAYGAPIDFSFYYVLPHYHARGRHALLEAQGMPGGDRAILDRDGAVGEVVSQRLDPPVDATGATALRFGCEFENDTGETIGWGNGDAEMCMVVAWQDSDYTWGGAVIDQTEQVGTDPDGTQVFQGRCRVAYLPAR